MSFFFIVLPSIFIIAYCLGQLITEDQYKLTLNQIRFVRSLIEASRQALRENTFMMRVDNDKIPSKELEDKSRSGTTNSSNQHTYRRLQSSNTVFYAIGDAPYNDGESDRLRIQIQNIPTDADFIVHVGDFLRDTSCTKSLYARASTVLKIARVPVFVTIGDNDWNDCVNPYMALQYWKEEFLYFDERIGKSSSRLGIPITRQLNRPENFSFVFKGTLFIGVNLVNGKIIDLKEWMTRLTEQFHWTVYLIQKYKHQLATSAVGRVVIFGHSDYTKRHDAYFLPLRKFVSMELNNSIPILYLHGDIHRYSYQPKFLDQSSLVRVSLEGLTKQPPLKVTVHANGQKATTGEAFSINRQL